LKKVIFVAFLFLSGCSSAESLDRRVEKLELEIQYLRQLGEVNRKNITSHNAQLQRDDPENYDTARIENHVKILDETFTRDLRYLREKLRETEKRVEDLEEDQK
jgi:predicted RNase H-like nuclease (RuvC/YqgF family)